MSDRESTCHPLRHALQCVNEEHRNAAVVLVTIVSTPDGEALGAFPEALQSTAEADAKLAFPQEYASEVIKRQNGAFTNRDVYAYTIMEYVPQNNEIRRVIRS